MHKTAIPNGIFLGVTMIICAYVLYIVNPHTFYQSKSGLLLAVIFLIFLKTGREVKTANGQFISFRQGFKNMFITGAIGVLICTIFEYILVNHLAPDLAAIKKELDLESIEAMRDLPGEGFFAQFLEQAMDISEEQIENGATNSAGSYFQQYLLRLVAPVAFVAALISSIIKRHKPSEGSPTPKDTTEQKGYVVNKDTDK